MKKETKDFEVKNLDWGYGMEISEMKKEIEELEKLGATHVIFEPGIEWGDCPTLSTFAVCRRLETDEEFAERVKEIEQISNKYLNISDRKTL